MAFTPAWRNFKRMQDLTVAAATLIYAAAAVNAFGRLPLDTGQVLRWTIVWPAVYFGVSLGLPLSVGPVKRWLRRYVWMSFQAGFGQTVASVLAGVGLVLGAGLFTYWQVAKEAQTGQVGANVFAAYAAGIGILAAQAILVRSLEQDPEFRAQIED